MVLVLFDDSFFFDDFFSKLLSDMQASRYMNGVPG